MVKEALSLFRQDLLGLNSSGEYEMMLKKEVSAFLPQILAGRLDGSQDNRWHIVIDKAILGMLPSSIPGLQCVHVALG